MDIFEGLTANRNPGTNVVVGSIQRDMSLVPKSNCLCFFFILTD